MRTLKSIGKLFVVFVITVALTGCTAFQAPILPAAGQDELVITVTGSADSKYNANITVTGNRSVTFGDDDDIWYYNVPDDEPEYALVETLPDGSIQWVHIYLHKSKDPNN